MEATKVIKYLDAVKRICVEQFGLKGEVLEAIEQAKRDEMALSKIRKDPFWINAMESINE